ncbi:hypothetical protein [Caulobacter sp. BP25]|uniref:hypothetical protein n=1 Tax=Caulobacter sp. BP25 TaxID=2048900 RepID=UPI000C12BBC0|nr:hypothetical protein [Caulobacter sp. BP25]PHY20930.1 hypothetical protein CSW59_06900 [Caulobacter sp. BP25]
MAITFPRAMPAASPARQAFEIKRADFLSPEAGGRLGAISNGFPLWYAKWTLGAGGRASSDEWRAFVDSLQGPKRLLIGRDYSRPYPLAYQVGEFAGLSRAGGGAFDGAATSWAASVSINGPNLVQLTGLPAGFVLSIADYVGFRWTTGGEARRAMVRTIEGAMANGAGVLQVAIEPGVPEAVPSNAIAHLDEPGCLMRLIPSETQLGDMDRTQSISGAVAALQDILP